ncbi:MAG: hypothetical protein HFP78_07345 [Methylococcales symbiont of Hymedesmia sp. n. MRB-2018]|nr:MAG: hypothetical protein HFP78_07345 [Methylococcales symbiont of Hymedesmia sp. n. MRB-2018]ORU94775.1 MAG: hypothetical protein A6F72_09195 [Cycloclasticus sp. symbiont of Poecilosclerida sp. N]
MCKLKNNLLVILMLIGFIFSTNVLPEVLEAPDLSKIPWLNCGELEGMDDYDKKNCEEFIRDLDDPNIEWVNEVEKTSMTMDEIRAYKFNPYQNGYRTTEEDIIAKTLIEKYDLWNAYKKAGGTGIQYVLKKRA